MGMISAMDSTVVHKICSGQVILDLSIAVKELVENALDSGATIISISLNNLDIEVSDNGTGISHENWPLLCQKNTTSKLTTFGDLETLSTFGFRGQALSSICQISQSFTLTTRTSAMTSAKKLAFSLAGELTLATSVAREVGTTVSITSLFHNLPVRFHEYKRRLKQEYSKMIQLLSAYALIERVKFTCFEVSRSKQRTLLLSTLGASLTGSIADLFGGARQLQLITKFDLIVPNLKSTITITGYISKPIANCGRNSGDRQFWSVNRRPCILSKLSKTVNETYKTFNPTQLPFFVLDIGLDTGFDLNLTPDKRTILLEEESELRNQLAAGLTSFFEPFRGILKSCQSQRTIDFQKMDQRVDDACAESEAGFVAPNTTTTTKRYRIDPHQDSATDNIPAYYPEIAPIAPERASKLWAGAAIPVNLDAIRTILQKRSSIVVPNKVPTTATPQESALSIFRSTISDSLETVADEFNTHLSKTDFEVGMQVVGQFNTGFIIVSLRDDLFIVDQHAADEKYNYENIRDGYRVMVQPLLIPVELNFSANQELVVEDNIECLKRNGFEIEFDCTKSATHRAKLLTLPMTAKSALGIKDLEEMVEELSNPTKVLVRDKIQCKQLLSMFASKACRTSVMIGTRLDVKCMQGIVRNLAGLEQPWNCPHGRPTIRHLRGLTPRVNRSL